MVKKARTEHRMRLSTTTAILRRVPGTPDAVMLRYLVPASLSTERPDFFVFDDLDKQLDATETKAAEHLKIKSGATEWEVVEEWCPALQPDDDLEEILAVCDDGAEEGEVYVLTRPGEVLGTAPRQPGREERSTR